MKFFAVLRLVAISLLFVSGCAQVPRQAVTLSATVGRDTAEMHRAHRELAVVLYDRMKGDVNAFVDNVYAPHQIGETLAKHKDDLVQVINEASRPDPSGDAQKTMLTVFGIYLEELRSDIEDYRRKLLAPLEEQERSLLLAIDDGYARIHYANSVVTGHLASVAQVYDTQDEVLKKANLEGLRMKITDGVVKVSEELGRAVEKARKGEEKFDDAKKKVEGVVEKVKDIVH